MTKTEPQRRAVIVATAMRGTHTQEVMIDHLGEKIVERVETSTDCPPDAIGEAAGRALSRAWQTGIDPALEEGFYIKVTFK